MPRLNRQRITLGKNRGAVQGSYEALAQTVVFKNLGTPEGVPRFVPAWRALRDSNPRPLDPKSSALSSSAKGASVRKVNVL